MDGLNDQPTELGVDTSNELNEAVEAMLRQTTENGISTQGTERLRTLLNEYQDVFRVRLGPGPRQKLNGCVLTSNLVLCHISQKRECTALSRGLYMKRFVDKLVEYGMAKANPHAEWASPPLLVPKSGSKKYRLTLDLRRVSQCTQPMAWPMPQLQSELM